MTPAIFRAIFTGIAATGPTPRAMRLVMAGSVACAFAMRQSLLVTPNAAFGG